MIGRVCKPYFSLLIIILLLRLFYVVEVYGILSPGQSLSGNQTIVSKGGIYEFGFFKPGKSQFSYAGIWYTFAKQTVEWVANREIPVSDPWSSEIAIHTDGNLVVISNSKIIWSSNVTIRNPNASIVILGDNGNLILKKGLTSNVVIWQSFDYPTDTWFSDARMSRNKITGEIKKLTPWKSFDDPAPGPFSLGMDPDGSPQFILQWNDSVTYWSSGNWNGQYFSAMPEMNPGASGGETTPVRSQYAYYLFENKELVSCARNISGSPLSITARFFLDISGQMKVMYWMRSSKQWLMLWSRPSTDCEVYAQCGAFGICGENVSPRSPCSCLDGFQPASKSSLNSSGWGNGCLRKHQLQCEYGTIIGRERDKFKPLQNVTLPVNPHDLKVGRSEDCEFACANNCSCTAYSYLDRVCSIWVGELLNIQHLTREDGTGRIIYLKVSAIDMEKNFTFKREVKRKSPTFKWEAIAIAILFDLLIIIFIFLGLFWTRRKQIKADNTLQVIDNSFVLFKYQQLKAATKNFSEIIGTGGFGTVYKGVLIDSTEVAVKKINDIYQGRKQFRAEVSTLATIQHVNLVRLRGFCTDSLHGLLVYDFMSNGSLNSHIFDTDSPIVDWNRRYNILIGVAKGLAYLHEHCRECIVHCDVKPENILIDSDFCPKVADFGLAKLIGRDFSRVLTTMRGTIGYLAPEWISGLPITTKADVYSFGMMLFEVLSGKRNREQGRDSMIFYPVWAATKVNENELLQLLDPRMAGNANMEELKRACRVGCWCIQDCEADRPSMGRIVQILEGVADVEMPPVPKFLQHLSEEKLNIFFSSLSSAPSS